jgi:hypothetical protein
MAGNAQRRWAGWNNWDQLGVMQQLGMAPGEVKVDGFLEERV